MIQFEQEMCGNLAAAVNREWLETNGRGGFASSTLVGLNTRRYHGLLTAVIMPPAGRLLLLSKLEETLIIDGRRFELSANQYRGVIHPQGHRYLTHFRLDPFPVFTYVVEGLEVEKSVFMLQGENSTIIQYEFQVAKCQFHGKDDSHPQRPPLVTGRVQLEVRPLIAFRDYHSTTHENGALNPHVQTEAALASVAPYEGLPALHFAHDAAELDPAGYWYRHFEYAVERERGLDFTEDLFSPFVLRFEVSRRAQAAIIASTERHDISRVATYRRAELRRRRGLLTAAPSHDEPVRTLVAAADQYLVARGAHKTVIAGYPWFSDWGRDTFIALRGLCLATGRLDEAREILLAWADTVSEGMLPNRFPDRGDTPEFNSVDASLWYVIAAHDFLRAMAAQKRHVSRRAQHTLRAAVEAILSGYARGTRYGIHLDDDGLLAAGEPGLQLTWMDAKIGDGVVTPRTGKSVEVQALWLNALRIGSGFSARWQALCTRGCEAFRMRFWNEAGGYLYDVVDLDHHAGTADATFRPNQIFAVGGLPVSLLEADRGRRVVEAVERRLWTPLGLRSLAPEEPGYVSRYEGGVRERDSAYHQGTVWPWLIGPFVEAWVRVRGGTPAAKREARARYLDPLLQHLNEAGLGHISEIADGEPPHTPRGCPFQAWSVGEALRLALAVLAEDEEDSRRT